MAETQILSLAISISVQTMNARVFGPCAVIRTGRTFIACSLSDCFRVGQLAQFPGIGLVSRRLSPFWWRQPFIFDSIFECARAEVTVAGFLPVGAIVFRLPDGLRWRVRGRVPSAALRAIELYCTPNTRASLAGVKPVKGSESPLLSSRYQMSLCVRPAWAQSIQRVTFGPFGVSPSETNRLRE